MAVFEVKDLSIIFHDEKEPMTVVDNLSFTVNKGEIMGLVGESGSGKTMTALAAAGLLGDRKAEIKGQIIIDGKEFEFKAPEKPNVISSPMPRHGHNANTVEEDLFVSTVDERLTRLLTIKLNLLKVGVFPGCDQDFHACLSSPFDCPQLKKGIQ